MACSCLLTFGVIILCCGTLLAFISTGTTYWITYDNSNWSLNCGLYRCCFDDKLAGISKCDDIEEPDEYVIGTRSCSSIAIVLSVIACVMSFIHLCKVSQRTASKSVVIAIVVLCSLGVVCLAIASIVYGTNYKDKWDLGASFGLNIGAAIGIFIGSILIFQSFNPTQVQPGGGVTIATNYPGAQPAFVHSGQHVMMPSAPAYGQPMTYISTSVHTQPTYPAYAGQQQPQIYYGNSTPGPSQPFATAANAATAQPQHSAYYPPPSEAKY